ncbi:hypothetical protein TRFO_15784 [Tritrichomonas foetus]|uniref:WH1 domain-containing protein n=1 Tax=Tritrichomonas foetus TaxID=1144522 RepID=A0A1J4KRJ0_9EUKA|nr:hypothetical protein TRFO_15784 [Tritrichomonas foetus]|eukprot:OHT13905.1 hypothetical protein TRFO_15784 [Tritrichomonas foetus]
MNVSSVAIEDRQTVITKLRSDNLIYLVKAKILVAFPDPNKWNEICSGNLALYITSNKCAYLAVFDNSDTSILFSHELYNHFHNHYQEISPTLYTFPSERCIIGVQFLLASEAANMKSQIAKASPKKNKKSLFKGIFSKKKKLSSIVISMPEDTGLKSGVQWDPEGGYQIDGSMEDLPIEHQEFMLQHGYRPRSP